MATNRLSPQAAAAALSSMATHAGNCNSSTNPKRMAAIKVWQVVPFFINHKNVI
ncbi:hypothetical protein [Hymenobacter coccineus]|uniref:hypothetical protein n=1 Tax=Hymenobacter coccineus TaxID=1908235 RepID=UPI001301856C|nr:hypothetical protein [Hymenobacter coccineus]